MPDRFLTPSNGLSKTKLEDTTALVSDVLSGKTFYSGNYTLKNGTMTNRGTWNSTINPGASVTIPAGYHNGSGKVTANSSQADIVLVFGGAHVRVAMNFPGGKYVTIYNDKNGATYDQGNNPTIHVPASTMKLTLTVKIAGNYRWLAAGRCDTGQGWHTVRYNGVSHNAPTDFTVYANVGDKFELEHTGGGDWSYWSGTCVYLGS